MNPNEHVVQTHLHLLENIKLADQKATAFVALSPVCGRSSAESGCRTGERGS